MPKQNPDVTLIKAYGTEFPIQVRGETPWVSKDFSDTMARATLIADMRYDGTSQFDLRKLGLFIGGNHLNNISSNSVLGALHRHLSQRFGHVDIRIMDYSDCKLTYELQLHPIPDGMTSSRFIGGVRQAVRAIAQQLAPPDQQLGHG